MREQPTGTLVLDYILKHKEKHGSYPSGYKVAKDLEIGMSTAKFYIHKLRSEGIIPECECRMRDRPGEDAVYDYIQQYCAEKGTHPTENEIAKHTGQARSTVRSHIARMLREKRIENKDGIYAEPGEDYGMSKWSMDDARRISEGIRRKDIEAVKKRLKIGDRVYVEDGYVYDLGPDGVVKPVYARVVSVHRHVVQLTGHLSCQLSQLAAGEKRKKKAGKKGKTWIAVRWRNTKQAFDEGIN